MALNNTNYAWMIVAQAYRTLKKDCPEPVECKTILLKKILMLTKTSDQYTWLSYQQVSTSRKEFSRCDCLCQTPEYAGHLQCGVTQSAD
jgi:hypothetical protein